MADPSPARRRSWLRIALVVSLALNLLVVGLVAGAFLAGPPGERRPGLRDLGFGPFVAALPRPDRRALARELRREEGPFFSRRAALRRQFAAFLEALTAEPYDHAAVVELVVSQQEEVFATQRFARDLLLDHIAAMTPDERAAYAAALTDEVGRRRSRGWRQRP